MRVSYIHFHELMLSTWKRILFVLHKKVPSIYAFLHGMGGLGKESFPLFFFSSLHLYNLISFISPIGEVVCRFLNESAHSRSGFQRVLFYI